MPETDRDASPAQAAGSAEEPAAEGTFFGLEDDQGLDVLEGLAQEDRPPVEAAAPHSGADNRAYHAPKIERAIASTCPLRAG